MKYFIFSKKVPCMFEFGFVMYNAYSMLLLTMKFFQICEMCATPCSIGIVDIGVNIGVNSKELVSISYLGDALGCITSQYF